MHKWLALSVCVYLVSCDSKQPPTTPPTGVTEEPAAAADTAAPEPEGKPKWADMTHDQKAAHMDEVVVPAMAAKFQTWDKERFGEFGCATCHGHGAAQGQFAMPNPNLPKLGDFAALEKSEPEVVAFMTEVEVEMAALLDTKPYDPETHEGFGCGACHTWESGS